MEMREVGSGKETQKIKWQEMEEEGKGNKFGRREDVWWAELRASFAALWLVGRRSMPCRAREGVSEAVVAGAALRRP